MVNDIRRLNISKKLKFTNVSVNCFPGTNTTLREKYSNTELILVRIFPHSDWIGTRKNSVFGHFSNSTSDMKHQTKPPIKKNLNAELVIIHTGTNKQQLYTHQDYNQYHKSFC